MFFRLLLLFILVPIVELALLLQLAEATSWQLTLLIVIATGIAGSWLARSQGLQTYIKIQQSLSRGEVPAGAVMDALLIFVAGGMLLTPGILTDIAGLALLIPLSRAWVKAGLTRWFQTHVQVATFHSNLNMQRDRSPGHAPPGEVIESYVVQPNDGDDERPET